MILLHSNSKDKFRKRGNKKDGVWKDIRADALSRTRGREWNESNALR